VAFWLPGMILALPSPDPFCRLPGALWGDVCGWPQEGPSWVSLGRHWKERPLWINLR
jgi:hypothetical protein